MDGNEIKKKRTWPLMIGAFTLAAVVTSALYMLFSGAWVSADGAKRAVTGDSAVKASEIQDENGRFVILDYPEYDASSYVTLGDYVSLTIEPVAIREVTDEVVQENYESYVAHYDKYEYAYEGEIHEGDIVDMTYTAYLDGKAVTAYSAEHNVITLGLAGEPDGFVAGVDGHALGEQFTFMLDMPEDWSDAAVAGQQLEFRVTAHSVMTVPELTDENVGEITDGEYDTAEAFLEYVRSRVEEYDEAEYESEVSAAVVEALQEQARFGSVPRELILWNVSLQMKFYQDCADQYGMTVEEYIAEAGIAESVDDMLYYMTQAAVEEVPRYAVLAALAQAEGITVDPEADAEEISLREEQLISGLGLSGHDKLLDYYKESNLMNDVLNWKVIDWLVGHVSQAEG